MEQMEMKEFLSGRAFFYRLFADMLYVKPREAHLYQIAADERAAALAGEPLLDGAAKDFFRALREVKQYGPADWARLQAEYIRLFDDPAHVRVCPWESVYLSREHVIFDEHTLAVQDFYRRWGMTAPDRAAGPADHIGIECSFLAYLSETAAQNSEKTDLYKNLSAQQEFLQEHVCRYIERFCQTLARESVHRLYQALAAFLYAYVTEDAEILAEMLGEENWKEETSNEF